MDQYDATGDPPLVQLCGIRASYEEIEVLHGVDLVVPAGTVVGVLGPNGAGKTTLLNVLSGLHRPSAGEVRIAGRDVTGADAAELARRGVCTIPEGRGVFPNLTVADNLWMATFSGRDRATVEERAFDCFPQLATRRRQPAGTLSGGEQQMLALARAVASDPALLLLDELSMGLAPLVVEELYEIIRRLATEGVTVVCIEQFAGTLLGVADLAAVLVQGRITTVGTPSEIERDLAGAYLGGRSPAAGPAERPQRRKVGST